MLAYSSDRSFCSSLLFTVTYKVLICGVNFFFFFVMIHSLIMQCVSNSYICHITDSGPCSFKYNRMCVLWRNVVYYGISCLYCISLQFFCIDIWSINYNPKWKDDSCETINDAKNVRIFVFLLHFIKQCFSENESYLGIQRQRLTETCQTCGRYL